jgi:adenosylmethionine-8-amino-7-oxononanoate aminotransferase
VSPAPPTAPAPGSLAARDLRVLWHPCTQMKDHESLPLVEIRRGEGVWLEDYAGRRYLDAISSWWVNLLGHAHPRIAAAIADQARTLEHCLFAGFTHEPGVRLAEALLALAPPGLARVFYGDNGSTAVEIALKMSFHYWRNAGRPEKRRFVTLANSYHGETLGALAVGDVALYKGIYAPLLFEAIVAPSPDAYLRQPGEDAAACARRAFLAMEGILAQYADEVAAVICEPLVQCAGNMRMYDPVYLALLREACTRHGVHLIADEVAVGFGRTGTMFACEQAGIAPDFLLLSKGLTGGFLPLAAVLTTAEVYQAFYDDYATLRGFLHSHSYAGNPIACRAALATLDLLEEGAVLAHNRQLAAALAAATAPLAAHPQVAEIRQTGMILAIEMVADKASRTPYPFQERRGLAVYRHGLTRGALLRPLGNVVYLLPPYVITEAEIGFLAEVVAEGIALATGCPG